MTPASKGQVLGRPHSEARGANLRSISPRRRRGDSVRDAQAGVPSAGWPRAQLAFKNSMVHGILQFTPSIAFRYVLHRCESRDIRCRESFEDRISRRDPARPKTNGPHAISFVCFLGAVRAVGFVVHLENAEALETARERRGDHSHSPLPRTWIHVFAGRSAGQVSTMILPQVHLRKPCYDFSFL